MPQGHFFGGSFFFPFKLVGFRFAGSLFFCKPPFQPRFSYRNWHRSRPLLATSFSDRLLKKCPIRPELKGFTRTMYVLELSAFSP